VKKIGLLTLVLIVVLASLGVGYAMWSDTVYIDGTIDTGMVVLCIEEKTSPTYGEINTCPPVAIPGGGFYIPDKNWSGWVKQAGSISCPMGYTFDDIFCVDKDVAWIEFVPVYDESPVHHIKALTVIIHNAYPYYLGHVTFELCNCGNIPLHVGTEVISQDPSLLIEYRNGAGQLEPGECHEISFFVGVTQYVGYWDKTVTPWVWVIDDPSSGTTQQDVTLEFTISLTGYQWNEWPLP